MSEQTLLLLDGHSLAFRAFYALRADQFRTSTGIYTNAIYGFANTLVKLAADYKPTHVAAAFDLPGGTFRTRQYSAYKAGRKATPEEFKGQIDLIQAMLDALGIPWFTKEDYEADDIVASFATQGQAAGMRVLIASGDKDSFQLVTDTCTVLYPMPKSQMAVLDPAGVEKKTGVRPDRYRDMAALVGESADNLPGVHGVGPKTTVKWLETYGSLEGILNHADEIAGKAGQALRDAAEQVRLNYELNHLVTDLELVDSIEKLRLAGADASALAELFDTLEIRSLRSRLLEVFPATGAIVEEGANEFTLENLTVATADPAAWFANHPARAYGLAFEGRGNPGRASLDRIAIADGRDNALVLDRSELAPADEETLATWLADPHIAKVCYDAKALRHALHDEGGFQLNGVVHDTLLQAYLLRPEQRGHSLVDLSERILGFDLAAAAPEDTLLAFGDTLDAVAAKAAVLPELATRLDAELSKNQKNHELERTELAVSEVLASMERAGIAVDEGHLEKLRSRFAERVSEAERAAYDAIGREINLSSPKQLSDLLFGELGLPKTRKVRHGYTTKADALSELLVKIARREDDAAVKGQAFLAALLAHRDRIKLLQSVEGLQRAVQADSRIRTTFQQAVTATGRLSSTEPNLQNIHARTEEGLLIREAFVAKAPYVELMTADYSQIEMRLMASFSGDEALIAAFREGADLHSYVASRVFGIPEAEVTSTQRSRIKAMSYGLAYGLSAFGLSRQLNVDVTEASALMDDYFSRFGKVRHYLDSLVAQARSDGFTQTAYGRRRYLPDLTSTNRQVREAAERAALNAPIQGSAADIIKFAMIEVDRRITAEGLASRMLLQVHDELIFEVAPGEREALEQLVREAMGNADGGILKVPLEVGVGFGENWRVAAH